MDSSATITGKSRLLVPGPHADAADKAPIRDGRNWSFLVVSGLLAFFVVVVLTLGPGTNHSARTMRQPMIGGSGSKREGPWPECIGMTGELCQESIQAYARDTRGHVEILEEGTPIMMLNEKQFVPERVRVWISADTALVNKVPRRG